MGWLGKVLIHEWVGGWVGGRDVPEGSDLFNGSLDDSLTNPSHRKGSVGASRVGNAPFLHRVDLDAGREWVGGWVGWVEEIKAVEMRCCELEVGGWVVGWVGGGAGCWTLYGWVVGAYPFFSFLNLATSSSSGVARYFFMRVTMAFWGGVGGWVGGWVHIWTHCTMRVAGVGWVGWGGWGGVGGLGGPY